MPRASKPCNTPGCPNLQPCPAHARKPWEGSTRRQKVGNGYQQQKRSKFVLRRDNWICHVCGEPGANQADHVIPVAEGGLDHVSNMKAIHDKPCHQKKSLEEARRGRERNRER